MSAHHEFETDAALALGWGVRVLVLAGTAQDALVARIAGLGAPCDVETELYAALSAIIDDPTGYGLFVIDCDAVGGPDAAKRALAHLSAVQSRLPVILVGHDGSGLIVPEDRNAPFCLRAPLSVSNLRVGFEHALRDRLFWRSA